MPASSFAVFREPAIVSEYQYYEFQALDRPLTEADRAALRALSSRARITSTAFVNSYEWGSFKGNPDELMARWFDLHLYLANWGTRRLMIRFPRRLIDAGALKPFLRLTHGAELKPVGENLVLDIEREEMEPGDDWDDGSGWLAALAPLRTDILGGDLRLFYLLWLMAVEDGVVEAAAMEPLPGIAPMTGALEGFAQFFGIGADLMTAAAERSGDARTDGAPASDALRDLVADLPDEDKTNLLVRLAEGDPHVASDVRARIRLRLKSALPGPALRTAGNLLARARALAAERKHAETEWREVERRRKAEEDERARRARLDGLSRRGEAVWREIEMEIERRNAAGYDRAADLLRDLKAIANERDGIGDFNRRLGAIRERHVRKQRFIERLSGL
jgi:hypothetical protein